MSIIPLITAGIAAVSAWMGNKAQNEAADAAQESAAQSAALAKKGRDQALQDLMAQMGETNVSFQKSKTLRLMQGLRDRAFIKSALAEGMGTRRSLVANEATVGADLGALGFSRISAMGQFARQKQSIESGLQSQLNQINAQAAQYQPVSPLNQALSIGLAGFQGWTQGKTLTAKYPTGLPSIKPILPTPAIPILNPGSRYGTVQE